MKWNKIIKWGLIIMSQITVFIWIIIFFGSMDFACVSVPKKVEGEPIICEKSSQWAYLAIKDKSGKFPESVSTSGVYSCVDTLKVRNCNDERLKFYEKFPPTGDKYNDLQNQYRADKIYNDCLSDMKR